MDLPVLVRSAMDGNRRIHFRAAVLGSATTARPGAPRWSELVVYRQPVGAGDELTGDYVVARIGRSMVVHDPECTMANRRSMTPIDHGAVTERYFAHLDCSPNLTSPQCLLERTRYRVLQARTAEDLVKILLPHNTFGAVVGMTAEIVDQVRRADPEFDQHWAETVAPHLHQ
jgi:hypothetical protein